MDNTRAFSGLEPRGLWQHFEAFTRIPRPSGHEERIIEHVTSWATSQGFQVLRDQVGNVCVQVPGRPPYEKAAPVVLQSHLDMVCERNSDCPYDTAVGNMHVLRDGDWLRAEGTTLGADNGIGCAAMMYLAESKDLARGPLDLLFTLDEERGLEGAKKLDPAILRGRTLLNLDSEDDGLLVVGCSGGALSVLTFADPRQPAPAEWKQMRIRISGLRGGHSGLDIDKGRLNANRAAARILQQVATRLPLRLVELNGGDKTNAIPRECTAVVAYAAGAEASLREEVQRAQSTMADQYRGRDDGPNVVLEPIAPADAKAPFSADGTRRLIDLMMAIPCGPLAPCPEITGLVETSNNLGVVRTTGDEVTLRCSSRSSVASSLREVLDSLQSLARLAHVPVEQGEGYPGWKPDMGSHVLGVTQATFRRLYKKEAVVTAIHAGLECGLIGERMPDMDMISLGPDIKGVHAPGEKVCIPSVQRFAELLAAVLADLAGQGR